MAIGFNLILGIILFFLILTFFLTNPIFSIICLAGVFLMLVIFLLALHIEFLALAILIVYVGAIIVLFLFVIMMLNIRSFSFYGFRDIFGVYLFIFFKFGVIFSFFFLDSFFPLLYYAYWREQQHFVADFLNALKFFVIDGYAIGFYLYGPAAYLLLLMGVILTSTLIAAVIICLLPESSSSDD